MAVFLEIQCKSAFSEWLGGRGRPCVGGANPCMGVAPVVAVGELHVHAVLAAEGVFAQEGVA